MRAVLLALIAFAPVVADDLAVLRCPGGGRIPDVALAGDGTLHMVYGRAADDDAYYVRAERPGAAWSEPVRINSRPGSCTVGAERGPRIALGADGVLHALWQRRGIWYARSTDGGRTWSEERDLLDREVGADSATILADGKGRVWAVWIDARLGEDRRNPVAGALFVCRSDDDGATFGDNYAARYPAETRACACCSISAAVGSDGRPRLAFRGALDGHRDIWFLEGDAAGERFASTRVSADDWRLDKCPMDGPTLALGRRTLVAWRSRKEVYFAGSSGRAFSRRQGPTLAAGRDRSYPEIALADDGSFLFAWAEGDDGIAWQRHDSRGRLVDSGRQAGRPGRARFAVLVGPDGAFYLVF